MKWEKAFFVAWMVLATLAGHAQENNYTIKGKIDEANTKVVYLDLEGKGYDGILDSAIVTNGEFSFAGKVSEPAPAVICNKNRYPFYFFILEPGNITFKSQFHAVGGTLNDSLTHLSEYPRLLVNITDDEARWKEFKQYAEAMYLRHKNDALGIKILSTAFAIPSDQLRLYNMGGPMIKAFPSFVKQKETWAKYDATSEGKMMLDIQSAYDGKRLSDYVGKGKYVLVDFWASWCPPCKEEIPNIIAAYNKYKDCGLQVLGLDCWDNKEDVDKAIEQLQIPYPQLYGITMEQTNSYGITGIPEIILFAPDGKIIKRGLRGEKIDETLSKIFK